MRRAHRIVSVLVFFMFSIVAYGAQDAGAPSRPDGGYRLGPKDGLNIVVWGHEDLSGKFTMKEIMPVLFSRLEEPDQSAFRAS